MDRWNFRVTDEAEKDLSRLDTSVQERVLDKLSWLVSNPQSATDTFALTGKWKGFFKLRVGDWRVIYKINDSEKILTVHKIERRDKVYK